MKAITHIFFDLDRTLWDFDLNSKEALHDLYIHFNLEEKGLPIFANFYAVYNLNNDRCWDLYRQNRMSKRTLRYERFRWTLKDLGHDDPELAKKIGDAYILLSPEKTKLIHGTVELLEYLAPKYHLHIITNGFQEVQCKKMASCKIHNYFKEVITSERVGRRKPDPKIFQYAIKKAGAFAHNSLMIGDDLEIDVYGATKFGMQAIWFNAGAPPNPHFEGTAVKELSELHHIL